jgi:multisubunit Na+/H+ antiporter MnhF subunit
MNSWTAIAIVFVAGAAIAGALSAWMDAATSVIGLELATLFAVAAIVLLALEFRLSYLFDLGIVFALLSFGGTLVFLHYMDAL